MSTNNPTSASRIRYQPDDRLSATLSLGLGFQIAVLSIAGIILIPTVVMRAADATEAYLSWAVCTAVAVGGAATILQAVRIGRIGMGYILAMGPSAAFIAVCITAVAEGGPAMLATLVVITSLVPPCTFLSAFAVPADLDAYCRGNCHHADTNHGNASHIEPAISHTARDPGLICSAECACNNNHHQRHRAKGDRSTAPVGTCHRRCRRLGNWRLLRSIRHGPRRRGFVDRHTHERMAGL